MEKILVTGGCGFIGTNLVQKLLEKNYKVIILNNLSDEIDRVDKNFSENKNLEIVKGDICDEKLLESLIKKVDKIVHLAAIVSIQKTIKEPELSEKINVLATKRLFELADKNNIEKVVYASSAAVYGDNKKLPLSENSETNPISPYGEHKLQNEKDAQNFLDSKTSFIGLRFQNVYGPNQNPKSDYAAVIPIFILRSLNDEPINIYGDGKQTRDFVFVGDVVNGIILALENENIKNEIFNIGTGKEISLIELTEKISKNLNKKLEINFAEHKEGDIKRSFANISKAQEILNYHSKYSLEEGLTQTINYLKKNIK